MKKSRFWWSISVFEVWAHRRHIRYELRSAGRTLERRAGLVCSSNCAEKQSRGYFKKMSIIHLCIFYFSTSARWGTNKSESQCQSKAARPARCIELFPSGYFAESVSIGANVQFEMFIVTPCFSDSFLNPSDMPFSTSKVHFKIGLLSIWGHVYFIRRVSLKLYKIQKTTCWRINISKSQHTERYLESKAFAVVLIHRKRVLCF